MVELAWLWLRNQPTSTLSLWFHERVRRLSPKFALFLAQLIEIVCTTGVGLSTQ